MGSAHLHERIRAALSDKHLGLRVAQHVVLRAPLDNLDVAADLQRGPALQEQAVIVAQFPQNLVRRG